MIRQGCNKYNKSDSGQVAIREKPKHKKEFRNVGRHCEMRAWNQCADRHCDRIDQGRRVCGSFKTRSK
jgi:hypothetical protein